MKQFILMADIIDSGKKDSNLLMENFKTLIKEINNSNANDILSPLTITLGDECQGVIKDLSTSIRMILNIEENIIHNRYNFKLRYVLNEGEIETPINQKIAYEMLGNGLTEARFKLNNLKNDKFRFYISIQNKLQNQILIDAFIIYENIVEKWNLNKDYESVSNFIKYKDYKIISDLMGKTRSLIWKREKSLNIESYNSIKNIIKNVSLKNDYGNF